MLNATMKAMDGLFHQAAATLLQHAKLLNHATYLQHELQCCGQGGTTSLAPDSSAIKRLGKDCHPRTPLQIFLGRRCGTASLPVAPQAAFLESRCGTTGPQGPIAAHILATCM